MTKVSWLVGLMLVLASSSALAVPSTMNFTGRLSTSAGPVTGAASITFSIFDAPTNGVQKWTETQASVIADAGLVFVSLGSTTPLDDILVFDGSVRYLQISVNGETLTPRMALSSVPYAVAAQVAETSDSLGSILPGDVVTTVTGSNGVTAAKTGNAVAVSLSTTGCVAGEVWKFNGSTFSCDPDLDTSTTYTGGTGIGVAGTVISLSTTGCVADEVWKFNGSTFSCEADAGSTYTGGNGIGVSGTTISLSTTGCVTGEVWKFNGSTFSCDPDVDTTTTYTGGTGIGVSGTTISLSTTGCVTGEVWKFNGTTFACELDADTTYVAGQGIAISGAIPNIINFSTTGCVAGEVWKYDGTNWNCDPDAMGPGALTAGAGIQISGGAIGLNVTGCVSGESWVFNGSTWNCVPAYADAMAVAAVTATTVTRTMSYGPTNFRLAASAVGIMLGGAFPSTNSTVPPNSIIDLPLDIETPATLTQVSCLVLDNDSTADFTMTVFNGNTNIGTASTTGGSTSSQAITISNFSTPSLGSGSRGPVLRMFTGASTTTMFWYQCSATYTRPALN